MSCAPTHNSDGIVCGSLSSTEEADSTAIYRHEICLEYATRGLQKAPSPEAAELWQEVLAFHQLAICTADPAQRTLPCVR